MIAQLPETITIPTRRVVTADELSLLPDADRFELVGGELVEMPPPGPEHGFTTASLLTEANYFIRRNRLGYSFTSETGFLLSRDPDTVLAPDFAFVRLGRITRPFSRPYQAICPALVIETLSPGTTRREAVLKTEMWLGFGVQLLWEVDPEARTVTVHRPGTAFRTLTTADTLTGEDVLPGFAMPVREIFELP